MGFVHALPTTLPLHHVARRFYRKHISSTHTPYVCFIHCTSMCSPLGCECWPLTAMQHTTTKHNMCIGSMSHSPNVCCVHALSSLSPCGFPPSMGIHSHILGYCGVTKLLALTWPGNASHEFPPVHVDHASIWRSCNTHNDNIYGVADDEPRVFIPHCITTCSRENCGVFILSLPIEPTKKTSFNWIIMPFPFFLLLAPPPQHRHSLASHTYSLALWNVSIEYFNGCQITNHHMHVLQYNIHKFHLGQIGLLMLAIASNTQVAPSPRIFPFRSMPTLSIALTTSYVWQINPLSLCPMHFNASTPSHFAPWHTITVTLKNVLYASIYIPHFYLFKNNMFIIMILSSANCGMQSRSKIIFFILIFDYHYPQPAQQYHILALQSFLSTPTFPFPCLWLGI